MVYVGNNFSSSSWSCCSAGGSCVQNYDGVSCIKTKSSSANCPLCPQYQTHLVHDGVDTGSIRQKHGYGVPVRVPGVGTTRVRVRVSTGAPTPKPTPVGTGTGTRGS